MAGSKTFKVAGSGIGFKGGRYYANTPIQAAKKAGSQLFRRVNTDPLYKSHSKRTSIKFIIVETTKGAANRGKTHNYIVTRKKKSKPMVAVRGNTTVTYEYDYTVTPCGADGE